jgi:DNA polymerase-4
MFTRAILHLDLDAFFVSVELLRRPELLGQPVIIGGQAGRGVVSSCSYEARAMGVRSAMPVGQAMRLCPKAVVIKPDMAAYGAASRLVRAIIEAEAPLFEQVSIDEFNLDLSGMDEHIGCWKWSQALRQKVISETGLPLSIGLAVNKTVAKIAAGAAKPNGEICVEAGTEKAFLAPMPVGKIPMVGEQTEKKLRAMGIFTIGQLAQTSVFHVEHELGKHGRILWEKANGIHDTPVETEHERVTSSHEQTFGEDIIDRSQLHRVLRDQAARLGFDLRKHDQLAGNVAIKIRYSNFDTFTRQAQLSTPTAHDSHLEKAAVDLFDKNWDLKRPVRLIGVRVGDLRNGTSQLNLFDNTAKEADLLKALDKIRTRFGIKAVRKL